MSMKRVIAPDHGNGYVKIRTDKASLKLPSTFGYVEDLGEDAKGKKLDLKKYKIGKTEYLWGNDISEIKGTVNTYGQQNRYIQETYKVLSKIALAEIAIKSGITESDEVLVVTGVPSDEVGKLPEKQIIEAYKGIHVVHVEDKEVIVNVTDVIVLPQPVGSVMRLYLDSDGYVANENYENYEVGIIDIGSGTTDLDIINCLRREPAFKSIPVGMNDVYKQIAEFIGQATDEPSTLSIEKCFNEGIYNISKRLGAIDFTDEKDKAIAKVANSIVDEVSRKWKKFDRFDEIIITGGGAKLFAPYLEKLMGKVTVVENHQMANVEGFYRSGKMELGE